MFQFKRATAFVRRWMKGKVRVYLEAKKAKGADLLTQFLRDYKHGAMNKFASNVVKASRTLQRFYRSFAACTQARLKLLLELYAEVEGKVVETERKRAIDLAQRKRQAEADMMAEDAAAEAEGKDAAAAAGGGGGLGAKRPAINLRSLSVVGEDGGLEAGGAGLSNRKKAMLAKAKMDVIDSGLEQELEHLKLRQASASIKRALLRDKLREQRMTYKLETPKLSELLAARTLTRRASLDDVRMLLADEPPGECAQAAPPLARRTRRRSPPSARRAIVALVTARSGGRGRRRRRPPRARPAAARGRFGARAPAEHQPQGEHARRAAHRHHPQGRRGRQRLAP